MEIWNNNSFNGYDMTICIVVVNRQKNNFRKITLCFSHDNVSFVPL